MCTVVHEILSFNLSVLTSLCVSLVTTKYQRVPVTVLWYYRLMITGGGASCISALWLSSGLRVRSLTKVCGLSRLSYLEDNNVEF